MAKNDTQVFIDDDGIEIVTIHEIGPEGPIGVGLKGDKGDKGDQGEKGDKGDPGEAASRIPDFIQSLPNTVWVINHNLGYDPDIEVIDSAGTHVLTEIVYTVPGAVAEARHKYPFAGRAILT